MTASTVHSSPLKTSFLAENSSIARVALANLILMDFLSTFLWQLHRYPPTVPLAPRALTNLPAFTFATFHAQAELVRAEMLIAVDHQRIQ